MDNELLVYSWDHSTVAILAVLLSKILLPEPMFIQAILQDCR